MALSHIALQFIFPSFQSLKPHCIIVGFVMQFFSFQMCCSCKQQETLLSAFIFLNRISSGGQSSSLGTGHGCLGRVYRKNGLSVVLFLSTSVPGLVHIAQGINKLH